MSHENAEKVREAVDAANARDSDAFVACLQPDVEWEESGDPLPGLRGLHRGQAEVRKWFEEAFGDAWESTHVEVEEITESSDDRVLLGMFLSARGKASGIETELRVWNVFWFSDGKIARRLVFWTRDEALKAAGLAE
jgi:ketosteroid isomerase-like protein